MPRYGSTFDGQVSFICDLDLRNQLVALAYMDGDRGAYAGVARNLMTRAVRDRINAMPKDEREEYKVILDAVRARAKTSRMFQREKFASNEGKTKWQRSKEEIQAKVAEHRQLAETVPVTPMDDPSL